MASADLKLTNQLSYVTDTKASGNHADDIDNQSNSFNYQYDEIGNLTKDISEEIEKIEWTVYGKIRRITRTATSTKPDLEFEYTPDGHRAVKIIIPKNSTMRTYTYYIRDAQGNIMATYSRQFQKTIDYANLSYTQVNAKLTEKTSPESFAWFVANAHASGATGLKNALKNDILSSSATTDWFLNHPSLNPELILNQESDLADRVWSNYNKVEVLKIIQGSGSLNLKQICICMKSRRGDPNSPNYKTFMEHVLSKSKLRSLFLAYLSANKPGLYSDFFSKLGIATVDLQTDLDNLITRINTNGVAAVGNDLLAANQYVDCDDYIISYQDYLNNYWDEQTEEELSQIEDFNEIFQNTNEDNFNFSCEELGLSYLFSLLNSQNTTTLRNTMIAQVQGTGISTEQQKKNWLVNWYFENDPMGSIYLATLRNPALVASYQTSQGNLYGTPFATGMENYFQKIKAHFGQSMFDQLVTEFAQQSNLYVDEIKVDEWHIYGSSRLGVYEANRTISKRVARDLNNDNQITNNEYLIETPEEVMYLYSSYQLERGAKRYELANHLGNVLTVISDKKTANFTGTNFTHFTAERISATDYSPFGAPLAGRSWNGGEYRFGFGGHEKDDEINGFSNIISFSDFGYDSRIGRRFGNDPIFNPSTSSYAVFNNNPNVFIDPDGESPFSVLAKMVLKFGVKSAIKKYAKEQIENRLKSYMSKNMLKQFAKDLDDVISTLDNSWWENAIEMIPVAGDIYGTSKFAIKLKKAYDKLQDIENKYVEKVYNSLPEKAKADFKKKMRSKGVSDARKDQKDGARKDLDEEEYKKSKQSDPIEERVEGHHKVQVQDDPSKMTDPRNILFMTNKDHKELHKKIKKK